MREMFIYILIAAEQMRNKVHPPFSALSRSNSLQSWPGRFSGQVVLLEAMAAGKPVIARDAFGSA